MNRPRQRLRIVRGRSTTGTSALGRRLTGEKGEPMNRLCSVAFTLAGALAVAGCGNGPGPAVAKLTAAVGSVPGYDVGVDYHATGADIVSTSFITTYQTASVRQLVRSQLQGIADAGASVVSTRIWQVTSPGGQDFGETWRSHFPISDQEQANLRAYAQDVAAIAGTGGNRLRLDVSMLYLGDAQYTNGSPATGLGYSQNISAADFTSRVTSTLTKILAAVGDVTRPDGVRVVDTIYLDGEVMIGAKANQEWFLTTHYPSFVQRVAAAGFKPSIYFLADGDQSNVLTAGYVDAQYPILNGHRSMYWIYRSLKFMRDAGLAIPPRIDFSCYLGVSGSPYATLLHRILADADASLPSLGAPRLYGAAETYYFLDPTQRHLNGQAFGAEAAANGRLQRVTFWTTPDGGGNGVNVAGPFTISDYFPPATTPPPVCNCRVGSSCRCGDNICRPNNTFCP
jgi:hypothetical protein